MYQKLHKLTAGMISAVKVQGLRGRQLTHPSRDPKAQRTIVFVYGIHGSLERFYGVIHYLARFGRVAVPDLPGFGGMEPFNAIGKRPSIDAHGDYLAAWLEQELPDQPVTLIGLSYGFVVITRMLVRHPQLTERVEMVVSAMGLADGRDVRMRGPMRWAVEALFAVGRTPGLGEALQYIITRPWLLRLMYTSRNPKMQALKPGERPAFIEFESYLWRTNHMRTYATCMHQLFGLRQSGDRVALPVHHIATAHDHWLKVSLAEQHIREVYQDITVHTSEISNHGGVAYADEDEAKEIIPPSLVKRFLEVTA